MLTRPKVRLALTRVGLVVGGLAVPAYLFCIFATLTFRTGQHMLALGEGAATYKWAIIPMPRSRTNPTPTPERTGLFLRARQSGSWAWLPRWTPPAASRSAVPFPGALVVPLWIPLFLGAVCGYYLLPSGPPRGRCATCNYDLRGVPKRDDGSTLCPECGTPTT